MSSGPKVRTSCHSMNTIMNGDNPQISSLLHHISLLKQLDMTLKDCLDPSAAAHCTVANLSDNMLIIHADASAWASKLRFQAPVILSELRVACQLPALKSVHIRVRPAADKAPQSAMSDKPPISKDATRYLELAAESTSDQELRRCFLKLAGRDDH